MNIEIIENDDGFLAKCPDIQGAFAEGDTPYEALYNLWDVLNMISDYRKKKFDRQKFKKGVSFSVPTFA